MNITGLTTKHLFCALMSVLVAMGLSGVQAHAENTLIRSVGGTIYIPAFSNAFVSKSDKQPLATILVVHNVDPKSSITLTAVRYYGSDGQVIRTFSNAPIDLTSFQSSDFAIEIRKNTGGAGANFIVEWAAETPVVEPVANALMTGGSGTQGLSFRTDGYVIERIKEPTQ